MVLPQQPDKSIARHHSQNISTYSRFTYEEFAKQFRLFSRKWTEVAKSTKHSKSLITSLRCDYPVCPVLYVLINTGKLPSGGDLCDPTQCKVRPIISSLGGPADRISKLLNMILTQLQKVVPTHLPFPAGFLDELQNTVLEGGSYS